MFAALLLPLPATAQTISTSAAPESVSVTIYRAPERSAAEAMQLQWLNGFALITETRRIHIPAGDAEIRFEGVAGGIVPESAIVTGLPDGVVEKNQDAWLLSPASLVERSIGRRVHLRRTHPNGEVREHEAVIRSGPEGALLVQTSDGVEALRCTGFAETIVYPRVPEGLSAKPTLSVRTQSSRSGTAVVTLSYLAAGFDWQANYVATLNPAGDRMDLFAWVTLASGDETSFPNASTQTVAGRLNREAPLPRAEERQPALNLRCWPQGRTSDIAERVEAARADMFGPPPPPPPPPPAAPTAVAESIVVTGSRVNRAQLEELGDLKLYRIPEPVTVASNSQKQVSLLEQDNVAVAPVWRNDLNGGDGPAVLTLRTQNRKERGLGLPLPAGPVVLFQNYRGRPILIGESSLGDKAIGEKVEADFSTSTSVFARVEDIMEGQRRVGQRLIVTNAGPKPVSYEARLPEPEGGPNFNRAVVREDGRWVWKTRLPANGSAVLEWR